MTINLVLLIAMTIAALWTVMGRSLLKAAIGLALTSVIITMLMFRLGSPLAAVFELSVCAGLITAVFVSAISLTKPMTHAEIIVLSKNKFRRYKYLLLILFVVGILLAFWHPPLDFAMPAQDMASADVRTVLWNVRQLDLFGQIVIMLAGAFGVVMLFREAKRK